MKRIAILGSFSGRNKGDLAILRAELIQIRKRAHQKLTIYIFTKDAAKIREYLSDIILDGADTGNLNIKILKTFVAYASIKMLPVLAMCDKIIVGGGGLFFDAKLFSISINQLLNLFIITLILKLLGKDFMIYAAGCSNLNSKLSRYMTRVVVKNAKIVTVRDELSRKTFYECAQRQAVLGADAAFLLEPLETERVNEIVKSWPKAKKILLSLHEFIFVVKNVADKENVLKQFLTQVGEFADQNGYKVLTYTNRTDQRFAFEIAELCGNPALPGENHLLPEELIYLFSKVDFVIASQMHVCMFAYMANVPFLSIPYAQKIDEFNNLIGNSNILQIGQMGDRKKVDQCIATAAAGMPLPPNQAVNENAQKLIDVLIDFIANSK